MRGYFVVKTHEDEPERPEVRPGPDYQLLGFAQTGAEHTDTMGTDFIVSSASLNTEDLKGRKLH